MTDRETLTCYDKMADDYAKMVTATGLDPDLVAFLAALPPGSDPVLDWGCGPGNWARLMQDHGITVQATDASSEMIARAQKAGVAARVETFDALAARDTYRGIWANFSLLHAKPDEVPQHIAQAADALIPGGILHLGMKEGDSASRDALGRYYSYWTEDQLTQMTQAAGLVHLSTRRGKEQGLAGTVDPFVIHLSRKPAP